MALKRKTKIVLAGAAVLLAGFMAVMARCFFRAAPAGTGFTAKYLCSSTFIANQEPQSAFTEGVIPVNPLAPVVRWHIDRTQKIVRADICGFFEASALYRQGCGCTLVVGKTEAELRRQHFFETPQRAPIPRRSDDLPWPRGGQGPMDPTLSGVNAGKLEAALDRAFAEPGPERKRLTRAVLVVYRGRLIAERYAPGFEADTPFLGWSMAKSVTNAMVGILVRQGLLDLRAPAPVPQWRRADDPRAAITLDQLLRMSSGLAFNEVYTPLGATAAMLYTSPDFGAYAARKHLEARPDSRWHYSSGTANIVAGIVRRAVEKQSNPYYGFLYRELFDRIGMTSVVMEPDPSGTFAGSSYIWATARDWARFGLLYLQDGVWNGERLLPSGWVDYSVTPTPPAPRGEYGAMFWLNAGPAADPGRRQWPGAPRDAYSAQGFREQKLFIVPSKNLILVRFGATTERSAWNSDQFLRDFIAALPDKGSERN